MWIGNPLLPLLVRGSEEIVQDRPGVEQFAAQAVELGMPLESSYIAFAAHAYGLDDTVAGGNGLDQRVPSESLDGLVWMLLTRCWCWSPYSFAKRESSSISTVCRCWSYKSASTCAMASGFSVTISW